MFEKKPRLIQTQKSYKKQTKYDELEMPALFVLITNYFSELRGRGEKSRKGGIREFSEKNRGVRGERFKSDSLEDQY